MRWWELVETPEDEGAEETNKIDVNQDPEFRAKLAQFIKPILLKARQNQSSTPVTWKLLSGELESSGYEAGFELGNPDDMKDTIVDMMDKELDGFADFINFKNPKEPVKVTPNDNSEQKGLKDKQNKDKEKVKKMAKDRATRNVKRGDL